MALLNHAASRGIDPADVIARRPRLSSRPFDSVHKFMRVTVEEGGKRVSYLKGAPEILIERSSLSAEEKQQWEAKAVKQAGEGYRVLALAWQEEEREEHVTFLGLVMLWDPPRTEVPDALRRAKAAGIRVVMITGDHPATAKAVGEVIGITTDRVVTGDEVARISADQLRDLVRHVNVFARVTPAHKLRLVEALKEAGEIVAVTGDGVNDAPALKRSDVGVAMGQRGSDVAREVADVVLLDDNFATIVAAIEEGRSIYENIQKFIRFFFSTDMALIVLMIAGLGLAFLLGLKDPAGGTFLLPLTAVQLLWINVVADGPPALALALDRNPGIMNKPPRPPTLETSRRCLAALHRHQRHGESRRWHCHPRRDATARLLAGGDADIRVPLRIHDAAGVCSTASDACRRVERMWPGDLCLQPPPRIAPPARP